MCRFAGWCELVPAEPASSSPVVRARSFWRSVRSAGPLAGPRRTWAPRTNLLGEARKERHRPPAVGRGPEGSVPTVPRAHAGPSPNRAMELVLPATDNGGVPVSNKAGPLLLSRRRLGHVPSPQSRTRYTGPARLLGRCRLVRGRASGHIDPLDTRGWVGSVGARRCISICGPGTGNLASRSVTPSPVVADRPSLAGVRVCAASGDATGSDLTRCSGVRLRRGRCGSVDTRAHTGSRTDAMGAQGRTPDSCVKHR